MITDPNSLEGKIQQGIKDFLKDPTLLPEEFKAWLPRWAEVNPPATQLTDIQGLYTMADTIAGLGVKINGRIGMIRAGSSPYEYLRVTYDSVLGKWVSDAQIAASIDAQVLFTNTSYAVQVGGAVTNQIVVNALNYYTAGLTPQISWAAALDANANGITINAQPSILEFSTGSNPTAGALAAHTAGMEYTRAGGAASFSAQTWEDVTFDLTPSLANWYFCWRAKVTSGQGELLSGRTSFRIRWVA